MTFQVALVCAEGVVLASDECETRENEGARETMRRNKIWISGADALMFAGDDYTRGAAREICDLLDRGDLNTRDPAPQMREICSKHYLSIPEQDAIARERRREITAVLDGKLWQLVLRKNGEPTNYTDRVTAGDANNTARFLTETYYEEFTTLDEMKLLAVYTVKMGALRNTSSVRGLGVAIFERASGKCSMLDGEAISALENASEKLHKSTIKQIKRFARPAQSAPPILPPSRAS